MRTTQTIFLPSLLLNICEGRLVRFPGTAWKPGIPASNSINNYDTDVVLVVHNSKITNTAAACSVI